MSLPLFSGQILSISDTRWLNFARSAKNACIFHHPAWSELLAQTYGYQPFVLAVVDADGVIQAGLPVCKIKLLTSRRWVSLPFTDHCAPLAVDEAALTALIDFALTAFGNQRPTSFEARWAYPKHAQLYSKNRFVFHSLQLEPDFACLSKQIHAMHRRNAQTAQKRGVMLHLGSGREELKEFYQLHLETRRRQGTPVQPWLFFENLRTQVLEKGLGYILLAYHQRTCLAAAIFLHSGETLTYKYGASSLAELALRPNDLIFWEAIRWGCENGYKLLDFGRTDFENTGLRDFKSRWGAQEMPLSYTSLGREVNQSHNPYFLKVLRGVIQKSPAWLCRLSGEFLYKYVG